MAAPALPPCLHTGCRCLGLHEAARSGDLATATACLSVHQLEPDVPCRGSSNKFTALMEAADYGQSAVFRLLLHARASPDRRSACYRNWPVLVWACSSLRGYGRSHCRLAIVRLLLNECSPRPQWELNTALDVASDTRQSYLSWEGPRATGPAILRLLLDSGAVEGQHGIPSDLARTFIRSYVQQRNGLIRHCLLDHQLCRPIVVIILGFGLAMNQDE